MRRTPYPRASRTLPSFTTAIAIPGTWNRRSARVTSASRSRGRATWAAAGAAAMALATVTSAQHGGVLIDPPPVLSSAQQRSNGEHAEYDGAGEEQRQPCADGEQPAATGATCGR